MTKSTKKGRPAIRKGGAMSAAERMRKYRKKLKRDNPSTKTIRKQKRRAEREAQLASTLLAKPVREYAVIYADPPWQFNPYSRETGMDRAADNHYPTGETESFVSHCPNVAQDCVCFLWATAPMIEDALWLLRQWGFIYKSQTIWLKDGRPGTGYWFRNRHEVLLVGTRGRIPAPAMGTQSDSVVTAPLGEHSEKPLIFHQLVERLYPTVPKIELYARAGRPGWDYWGLDAPSGTDDGNGFDSEAKDVHHANHFEEDGDDGEDEDQDGQDPQQIGVVRW